MRSLSIGRSPEVSPFDHLNSLMNVSKKQQRKEALASLGKHFDKDGEGGGGIERERVSLLEERVSILEKIADLQKKRADALGQECNRLDQDCDRIVNEVNKEAKEFNEYVNQYVWYKRRRY